jgi:dihydroxyacetone kinase
VDPELFRKALFSGLERVIAAAPEVTRYDSLVGDGDCGTGLQRGAEAIQRMLGQKPPTDDVLLALMDIIHVVENTMDGTSGALYAIYLNMLAHNLRSQYKSDPTQITPQIWARALTSSLQAIERYTPAKPGDRTLMDALYPFSQTLEETGSTKRAAEAAKEGTDKTKGMKASLGRSVYVGGDDWKETPDPGAYGLSEFLTGLAAAL